MKDQLDISPVQRCAWSHIRRTDRVITQFYDRCLAPSGLSTSQFMLLATLSMAAPVTINRLAEVMDIDRTTLTRNLEMLDKQHLVQSQEVEGDRRMRRVLLTQEGEQIFRRALPLWQTAQTQIEQTLGWQRFNTLLTELSAIRAAIN